MRINGMFILFSLVTPLSLATASGPRTACSACPVGTQINFNCNHSSRIEISNCEAITNASGIASGFAIEIDMYYSATSAPSCDPEADRSVELETYINGPVADVDLMSNRYMSATASVSGNSFSFTADLGSPNLIGPCYIESNINIEKDYYFATLYLGPYEVGTEYGALMGGASASGELEIESSEPLKFIGEMHVDATLVMEYFDFCTTGVSGTGISGQDAKLLTGSYYRLGESTGIGAAGLIANSEEYGLVRLGIFADPAVSVSYMGDDATVSGDVDFEYTGSGTSITVCETWLDYSVAVGDLNGDGYFSYCDESNLLALVGTVIGDAEYDPRGDMDIDGDIDNDDVDIARGEYERAIPNYGCEADYNRDGSVNFFDVVQMQSDMMNNQLPEADLNCDGVANFFDFSYFLTKYNAGC